MAHCQLQLSRWYPSMLDPEKCDHQGAIGVEDPAPLLPGSYSDQWPRNNLIEDLIEGGSRNHHRNLPPHPDVALCAYQPMVGHPSVHLVDERLGCEQRRVR